MPHTSFPLTATAEVRAALLARREIALLDVRTEAAFAESHPLFAANMALSRIALEATRRIPRRDVPIVVYGVDAGSGEDLAPHAAGQLAALGYTQLSLLDGGLEGWAAAGGELFRDVNVPSKAFGELVEAERHTPSFSAQEVQALLDAKADVVVLDARRFEEYRTMAIPGGISVPGGELALRVRSLAPDPKTQVIVNCAGRTRSIIGTQSLVNAGIPNPVAALRNGTIGWTLAGQALAHGQTRRFSDLAADEAGAHAEAARSARDVADRARVGRAQADDLRRWRAEPGRTTYCFDVRTPEEFEAGHLPGFASAPGGQLVQETDVSAPVRGARIVLADGGEAGDGVRANMTASWLAQMGWEVFVLDHLRAEDFTEDGPVLAPLPPLPAADRYRRPYEGTDNPVAAMQAYLDWEFGLVAQLGRDGTHGFFVI